MQMTYCKGCVSSTSVCIKWQALEQATISRGGRRNNDSLSEVDETLKDGVLMEWNIRNMADLREPSL